MTQLRRIIWVLALIGLSGPVMAEDLYKVRSDRGVITFTSRKPPRGARYDVIHPLSPKYSSILTISGSLPRAVSSDYDQLIFDVAAAQAVDPALVKAVVHAESAFNPFATSNKGAMGLMQLMPQTARRFGVRNAYHPLDNLSAGTKYLKWLLQRYDGNLRLALAAYNSGEQTVDRFREVPPITETQVYVRRVMSFLEVYRCVESGKNSCRT